MSKHRLRLKIFLLLPVQQVAEHDESEEEFQPSDDSESDKEVDPEFEPPKEKKEKQKQTLHRDPFDTDDEQFDESQNRANRRNRRAAVRAKMCSGPDLVEHTLFVMDDENWLKEWFLGRIVHASKKFQLVRSTLHPSTVGRLLTGDIEKVRSEEEG